METTRAPMDFCSNLQRRINALDDVSYENDPKKHDPMKPLLLWLREECRMAKRENLEVRRTAMKELMENDHQEIQASLLRIGMGFIPTHP